MKNILINIIRRQKQERDLILEQKSLIRTKTKELRDCLESSLIKVVIGPRRAGKSTLCFQALNSEHFGYFNFEDDKLPSDLDTDQLLEALNIVYEEPKYIFLDEIQNLDRWEQFANKLHRRGINLILSGSNSKLLSGELASSLTGRFIKLELLGFSFNEYINYLKTKDLQSAYKEYAKLSAYPDLLIKGESPDIYVNSLFDSIILKDIVNRHRIRNANAIYSLCTTLVQSLCSKFSYRQLEKSFSGILSINTIRKYLAYAIDAYLFCELQAFSFKPKLRNKYDKKIYAYDHGYINFKALSLLEPGSQLLENIVLLEFLRRGLEINKNLFYYQTKNGFEVDFLVRNDSGEIELTQVSYKLLAAKTRERELRSIAKAANELNTKKCTLITYEEEGKEIYKGVEIQIVRVVDWLLDQHS